MTYQPSLYAALEPWQPIPQEVLDQTDREVREQVGTCWTCGGPADGTCCDHGEA